MSMNYQSMHSMVWTSANTNTFSLFSSMPQQQQPQPQPQSHFTVNVVSATSSDEEFDEDEEEDMVVDLNSGSLEPQSLNGWNLLSEITQKMKKL
ncbi:hypothetical protein C6P44_001591 [Monosporozyma unispora]|nr:hypothetical protein C6P44_001591 [Kazachstania unispora]